MTKKLTLLEGVAVLLTGKRRYRCHSCGHGFRARDRRSNRRPDPSEDGVAHERRKHG
jgi:transposase-like protein